MFLFMRRLHCCTKCRTSRGISAGPSGCDGFFFLDSFERQAYDYLESSATSIRGNDTAMMKMDGSRCNGQAQSIIVGGHRVILNPNKRFEDDVQQRLWYPWPTVIDGDDGEVQEWSVLHGEFDLHGCAGLG